VSRRADRGANAPMLAVSAMTAQPSDAYRRPAHATRRSVARPQGRRGQDLLTYGEESLRRSVAGFVRG
jgi:hypothetical protein